jgi:hypothetical protein
LVSPLRSLVVELCTKKRPFFSRYGKKLKKNLKKNGASERICKSLKITQKTWYVALFGWFLFRRGKIKQKIMNPSCNSIIIVRLFFFNNVLGSIPQVSRAGKNGLLRDEQQHEAQEGVLEQVPDPWFRSYHGEPKQKCSIRSSSF